MKILLDPLLYWYRKEDDVISNFEYLKHVTLVIEKYFDIKYFSSTYLINVLKTLNREPFGQYKVDKSDKRMVMQRLLTRLDYENNITEDDVKGLYSFPSDFSFSENVELNNSFLYVLDYALSNRMDCLFLLALQNQECEMELVNQLFIVKHISGEINSKLTELIVNNEFIKNQTFILPTINNPLPNKEICNYFYCLQCSMVRKGNSRLSVFLEITKEVALRNGYTFDRDITNKNNSDKHKRKIYNYNKSHYISADFETGCFELCDKKGRHHGEFSYVGDQIGQADTSGSHDIVV